MKPKKSSYDVIVIGAGVNGLTTAAALGRKRKSVLLVEANDHVGGLAASEEFHPGYKSAGVLHDPSMVRPRLIRELSLERHGLRLRAREAPTLLVGDEATVRLDDKKALAAHSSTDVEKLAGMRAFMERVRPVLAGFSDEPPVNVIDLEGESLWDLMKRGLRLRRLGRKDMFELMRIAPMCIADWLNEWLDDDLLKAGLALPGVVATYTGPWSPGSNANLLLLEAMRGPGIEGGSHSLVAALEACARDAGVEILTGALVQRIEIERATVTGVALEDGTEVRAPIVAASCDPRTAFFDLMDPKHLGARLEQNVRNYRARGTTAQLLVAVDREVKLDGETVEYARVASHVDDIEKAFDPIKYRELPTRPVLDLSIPTVSDPSLAPEGHSVLSILVSFVPETPDEGWTDSAREKLTRAALDRLTPFAPDLQSSIVATRLRTPGDLADAFRLSGGNLHHGERAIDQLLVRPFPECATHDTPIAGFFLCGGGTHPGGGLHGGSGLLAARAILSARS